MPGPVLPCGQPSVFLRTELQTRPSSKTITGCTSPLWLHHLTPPQYFEFSWYSPCTDYFVILLYLVNLTKVKQLKRRDKFYISLYVFMLLVLCLHLLRTQWQGDLLSVSRGHRQFKANTLSFFQNKHPSDQYPDKYKHLNT
jgi:hypothetical protein